MSLNALQAVQPQAGLQNPAAGGSSLSSLLGGGGLPGFGALNQGGASPMFGSSGGLSGLQQQTANDPLAQFGLQSMSPDTQQLFFSLQFMMVGLMASIAAVLAGILNGSISGTAPPGSNGGNNLSGGNGSMATSASTGGNKNKMDGMNNGMANAGPQSDQGFVLPLPKQYIKKPGDSGDFGDRVPPTAGASSFHEGDDFGAPAGTPITAVKSGTIHIKPNNGGAGNTVEIDHGNGLVTRYLHLSAFGDFKDGDKIEQGQVLGKVGTTGTSTGPHLHFEVIKNGKKVDPWPFLSSLV